MMRGHGVKMGRWLRISRRSPVVAFVILLAGVLTACGVPGVPLQPSAPLPSQTAKVQRGTIQTAIGASGVVQPLQEVTLSFPSGETIKAMNATVGQRVKVGDLLGVADTADLQLTLQQQQSNVASAQAKYNQVAAGSTQKDIDVAQANVDAATAKYQATATINPKDIQVAQANLDSAIAKYNAIATVSPKDIEVARSNLDSAIAKYNGVATVNPKDIEVARSNLDSAIAKYNGIIQGSTTPQDIANAEASVRSAQAKLDALRAGPLKADVISAQSKVQQQQQNLDKVKSDSANTKEQARIKWEQSADATRDSQRKFDVANATYQQARSTNKDPNSSGGGTTGSAVAAVPTITPLKLETYKQAADSAYLAVQQAEKTQEANRLTYENAKNAELNNIPTAQQQLNDAQSAVSKLVAGPTNEDVTQAQATLDQAKAQLDKLKRGPNDSDVASAQASIDSARATLNDLLAGPKASDVAQAQATVNSARATLNDLLAGPKASDVAQAQATVDSARATLNDLINGPKSTDLQQAQSTVNSAQATLNDLKAGAKPTDLETALATLDQAKAQRDLAQLKVNQGTLTAPIPGVLTQVNGVPGQSTGGGSSTSGTTATSSAVNFDIVDDSELHIDVNVSESDAGNIKVGQVAAVTLDSVPGQPLQGSVQRINPVATTTSNVTAFPVRIMLSPTSAPVRAGANATVQIVTNRLTNVLTVPSRAVQTVNGQQAVTVLFNNSTFLVPVRAGLTDGRNTEIVSGLNEGDTVVLPTTGGTGATGGGAPAGAPRPGG
jgi:HlyD family secretion protein